MDGLLNHIFHSPCCNMIYLLSGNISFLTPTGRVFNPVICLLNVLTWTSTTPMENVEYNECVGVIFVTDIISAFSSVISANEYSIIWAFNELKWLDSVIIYFKLWGLTINTHSSIILFIGWHFTLTSLFLQFFQNDQNMYFIWLIFLHKCYYWFASSMLEQNTGHFNIVYSWRRLQETVLGFQISWLFCWIYGQLLYVLG